MKNSLNQHIWKFSKPYLAWIGLGVAMTLLSTGCDLFIADVLRKIIDLAMNGKMDALGTQILAGLTLLVAGMAANYGMTYCTGRYSTGIMKDIRQATAVHLQKLPYKYIYRNKTGEIIAKMSGDAESVQSFMEGAFVDLLYVPVMIGSFSIYLAVLDWRLFLACFSLLPILLPISIQTMKPVKACSREYVKYLGKTNNNIQDVIDGIGVVKSFNLQDELLRKYCFALKKALDMSLDNDKRQYVMDPVSYLIVNLPVMICLFYGGYRSINGSLSLGGLAAFLSLLKLIIQPLFRGYQLVINSKAAMASAERVFAILDETVEPEGGLITAGADLGEAPVFDVKNISFSYDGKTNVLRNFSLVIPKNRKIALVGNSGSGKSTVLKLLCRFNEISAGSISFQGMDLQRADLEKMREKIAYVSQDSFLFPLTISENIAVGKEAAGFEEIVQAAKMANAHDFIMTLPDGYQTLVGERGTLLSGGQVQRIAVARAILKNAPILLLDEATSALDPASEKLIQQALDHFGKDKTMVIIAHRLSTIEAADEIAVMEHGTVVERGTHQQLFRKNGSYHRLHQRLEKVTREVTAGDDGVKTQITY